MIVDLLHIPFAALACFVLWRFWRSMAGRGRASLIIAAGFLIRAFGSQILFWISYFKLPVARALQLGDGFWFFAVDGPGMLAYARELTTNGPMAFLMIRKGIPSHAFIQVFTLFAAAFGTVASVAILLNCAAFLATCALILRIGAPGSRVELPRLVALAAMALGPGTILWSLQLLKDTFFLFLIAAMIACCFYWQELWRVEAGSVGRRTAYYAAAMFACLYAIAGIRWYLAVFFWGAWSVFGLLTALCARRKVLALLVQLIVFVLFAQAVRLGGSNDVPQSIRGVLDPRPSIAAMLRPEVLTMQRPEAPTTHRPEVPTTLRPEVPSTPRPRALTVFRPEVLRAELEERRRGFESAPAATAITVGRTSERGPGAKLAAGLAAAFLPRFIVESFGFARIGGGRGFWFFVELDTLVVDAVLLFAIVFCAQSLRAGSRVTPLFVMLLIVFVATAVPLAYTVSNFGTLFRLRQMLYALLLFLPLTLRSRAGAAAK